MNKPILIILIALAGSLPAPVKSIEPTRPNELPLPATAPTCCVVEKKPARCCAEQSDAGPATVLSNRSLYQVDTAWTDDQGTSVPLKNLRGHVVIVAMFFAQCEYACPMIVNDIRRTLAALPADLRAKTRILLVTFDPERDTTAALGTYRERAALDSSWTLLRGEPAAVQELAMLLGVKYRKDARGQFSHSNLITVLNPGGEIAYQRAGLQGDISELAKAVGLAAN